LPPAPEAASSPTSNCGTAAAPAQQIYTYVDEAARHDALDKLNAVLGGGK